MELGDRDSRCSGITREAWKREQLLLSYYFLRKAKKHFFFYVPIYAYICIAYTYSKVIKELGGNKKINNCLLNFEYLK